MQSVKDILYRSHNETWFLQSNLKLIELCTSKIDELIGSKPDFKEEDDEYMISGCMVAAKLGLTICNLMKHKDYDLTNYCEVLTGLSILSDMIPMNKTVRNVMSLAMIAFNVLEHPGLRALMTLSGFRYGSDITTNFLSFILIPKINATGRMNKVDLGMKLLLDRVDTSDNNKDSLLLANELINCNRSRKTLEDIILNEAFDLTCQIYRTDTSDELPSAIVVHKSSWATGVIGIVAARLTDIFKVPVICLTGEDVLHGSGRAPEGYDLYAGLEQCKDLLIQFGGHKVAGGLSLNKDKLTEFRNKLSEVYASQKDVKYVVHVDATATIKDIKAYKPSTNSLSSGQVLHCAYTAKKAKLVVKERMDFMTWRPCLFHISE